jgi:hypothetical protein
LANPVDGPEPNDEAMFIQNAKDKVKRNRHHAAIALYCGRNEGNPPETLDSALLECTTTLDGTRYYIPHSAGGSVSGFGPYSVQDSEWYFEHTGRTLHSERGMPNIPALESLERMLPPENRWPIDVVWGIHDFTSAGWQKGSAFISKMQSYGNFNDLPSFAHFAQLVNYEGHKSMYEAVYTNRANGMLMWMSQSAWPSMVWQTYDYYYDTNGGYFGLKKANQPVNAIYNQASQELVLVNTTADEKKDLNIALKIFGIDGKLIRSESFVKSIAADECQTISKLDWEGLSGVVFIKTQVNDADGKELADNFTWINVSDKYNYAAFSEIPEATLKSSCKSLGDKKDENLYSVTLHNTGSSPALMIRVKTLNNKTKERVLPAYYQDNYFSLMPDESKTITVSFDKKYLRGGSPEFYVEGWNKQLQKIN